MSSTEHNQYDALAKLFDVTKYTTPKELKNLDLKTMLINMTDNRMREEIILACEEQARALKCVGDFREWLKTLNRDIQKKRIATLSVIADEEAAGYDFGDYSISDRGIYYLDSKSGYQHFCKGTPLVVSKQFDNIDGEPSKIEITFKLRGRWKKIACDLRLVSDSRKIVDLSEHGLSTNSIESAILVKYISDFIAQNTEKIPVVASVGRLGWHGDEFIPYEGEYAFDGFPSDKERFAAFKCNGSLGKWLTQANLCRENNPIVRMVLDASFASPLLYKLRTQMFLVHLWGATESGKTVAMSHAMSVWGDSSKLIQTFNATAVGLERIALFYKHLPIALDELQTVKDKYNNTDKMIYQLCSGTSKVRGNKFGGNDEQLFWNNVIISTGEQPLTDENSGGGAKNRVIELHCDGLLYGDFRALLECIDDNYGIAGKTYVDEFIRAEEPDLRFIYKDIANELAKCSFTDKQRNSIAVMCLADYGYNRVFLGQCKEDALKNALNFYKSNADMFTNKEDIKIGGRSYDHFISWVIQNTRHFDGTENVDQYGVRDDNYVSILPTALDMWCDEAGYVKRAVLSEWKSKELVCGNKNDKYRSKISISKTRINGYKIKFLKEKLTLADLVEADDDIGF